MPKYLWQNWRCIGVLEMTLPLSELRRQVTQTDFAAVTEAYRSFSVSALLPPEGPAMGTPRTPDTERRLSFRGVLGGIVPPGAHNLEIIQATTLTLLRKQDASKAQEYETLLTRELDKIDWDSYGPEMFVRRFEVEYDMLCRTVLAEGVRGMWPIVTYDLMRRLDSELLHPRVPALVARHPEPVTAEDIGANDARRVQAVFRSAADELQARLPSLATLKKIAEALERAAERFLLISSLAEFIAERWERFQQARADREAADREVERFREALREARPIDGAEDHVDAFERNRDFLKGLA
jgi:hypothetical protein